ncbi:DUF4242 domain-containing protein [Psychromarinibacter sp. S121]|uniref:DUF4242 domain-containing protein n=1 Tax=Psychromarinibacter sp. S121 TaxID=3415127 RepID=UPI003C7C88D1
MQKFMIERKIPGIGRMKDSEIGAAAGASNKALAQLAPDVQWQHSYIAGDKSFCVYLATDEAAIRKHAEISGFPADVITRINKVIDPTTENQSEAVPA